MLQLMEAGQDLAVLYSDAKGLVQLVLALSCVLLELGLSLLLLC